MDNTYIEYKDISDYILEKIDYMLGLTDFISQRLDDIEQMDKNKRELDGGIHHDITISVK